MFVTGHLSFVMLHVILAYGNKYRAELSTGLDSRRVPLWRALPRPERVEE